MTVLRKAVALSLAVIGTYYAWLASFTLLTLPETTRRWIYLSNDADFRLDYEILLIYFGVGAVLVLVLGLATAVCGMRTVAGRPVSPRYWIALAIAAPLIHFPWFMYRVIASGRLPREAAWPGLRTVAIRFGVICAAYILTCILTRRGSVTRTAG